MRRLISLALLLLLVTGCGTVGDKKKSMSLQSTIRAYESTIRWGNFEEASSFINPEVVTEPGPDPNVLKGIKVTSYVSTITGVSEDGTEANVIAEIQYYNDRSMSVRGLTDRQVWRYDAQAEKWYLAVPLPPFK
jgi:hypothetical protein